MSGEPIETKMQKALEALKPHEARVAGKIMQATIQSIKEGRRANYELLPEIDTLDLEGQIKVARVFETASEDLQVLQAMHFLRSPNNLQA